MATARYKLLNKPLSLLNGLKRSKSAVLALKTEGVPVV
jgi:hypothetical protein